MKKIHHCYKEPHQNGNYDVQQILFYTVYTKAHKTSNGQNVHHPPLYMYQYNHYKNTYSKTSGLSRLN